MLHLDLFSGIGGFAYAADQVFEDVEHIFCDNEPFAQQVLHKHWPEAYIYDDIKAITDATDGREWQSITEGHRRRQQETPPGSQHRGVDLLTGGFPCQPFSAAGLRRGTADERHLWPEMLRVIRLTQPTWVIAENVRGLLTWNGGLQFEQVCTDLEACGYEVQPLIIPAVAVNAPHRRDRIWFVAHRTSDRRQRRGAEPQAQEGPAEGPKFIGELPGGLKGQDSNATDSGQQRWGQGGKHLDKQEITSRPQEATEYKRFNVAEWGKDWPTVATELCSLDDGLPAELDGFKLSKPQHRAAQLKAYGNAIVPQVAMEIMQGIKAAYA